MFFIYREINMSDHGQPFNNSTITMIDLRSKL